jgi:hypothetical protein
VLGQSHNLGWTARIDGGVDLGEPVLVDGFANGWRIDPPADGGVVRVHLEWTPQRRVRWSLILSALAVVGALGIALVGRRRHGRPQREGVEPVEILGLRAAPGSPPRPGTTIAIALGVGALGALVVRPAAGLLLAVLVALALLRPWGRAVLALTGPLLLFLVGVFITVQQARFHYPPIFEWPTLFPRVRTWAWIAALVPATVWLVDRVRGDE